MVHKNSLNYKISRFFCKTVIKFCESLFKKYNNIKMPDFDKDLKENFDLIKKEYIDYINSNNIPATSKLSQEQSRIEDKENWKMLVVKIGNYYNNKIINHFPKTIKIIKKYKNIIYVSFSIMESKTHILPHRGLYNGIIRYHLGIFVPKHDDVYLKVNDKIIKWKDKESFIFDDTSIHEAVNNSDEKRVIMMIDFYRPLPFIFNILNKIVVLMILNSPIIKNMIENVKLPSEDLNLN